MAGPESIGGKGWQGGWEKPQVAVLHSCFCLLSMYTPLPSTCERRWICQFPRPLKPTKHSCWPHRHLAPTKGFFLRILPPGHVGMHLWSYPRCLSLLKPVLGYQVPVLLNIFRVGFSLPLSSGPQTGLCASSIGTTRECVRNTNPHVPLLESETPGVGPRNLCLKNPPSDSDSCSG